MSDKYDKIDKKIDHDYVQDIINNNFHKNEDTADAFVNAWLRERECMVISTEFFTQLNTFYKNHRDESLENGAINKPVSELRDFYKQDINGNYDISIELEDESDHREIRIYMREDKRGA